MFSDLWKKIKELVRKMLPKKTIEDVLHITPAVSDRMADAIQLWSDMYEGNAPWLKAPTPEDRSIVVSLGLPALIASEKARMVTLEMKSEINAPMEEVSIDPQKKFPENTVDSNLGLNDHNSISANNSTTLPEEISNSSAFVATKTTRPKGPTERAEFLNKSYKKLLKQIRRQLEYGIAKGGLVIKPYIVIHDTSDFKSVSDAQSKDDTAKSENAQTQQNNSNSTHFSYNRNVDKAEIEFDFVQADRFFPLSFDANGKVIEAVFIQTKVDKAAERVYIRLEYHKLEHRRVTVRNLAFESTDMNIGTSNNIKAASNLGKQIPLSTVPEWASLEDTVVIEDVDKLLFAYFKMPEANTIDPYSPLGVSGYSRVVGLIRDADNQYSRLLWEFEGSELAIDVDRDALKFITKSEAEGGLGYSKLPEKQDRLFRRVDLNAEDTYEVFSPAIRDGSIINGLNAILTRIEDATGLSRGTLSEVTSEEAKTATELKILKQRSFATNADIQAALQDALEDAIYVADVYCSLYEVTPEGEYEVSFEWDDSIIVDSESELTKRITLQQNKLASRLENRMWYFGETENQARAALQQIDLEETQALMQNAQASMMIDNNNAQNKEEIDANKSQIDDSYKKISKGKQADSLDNPNKSKAAEDIKNSGKNT